MTDESDPEFTVTIDETTGPVEAGETITVTVSVENVADSAGSGDVTLQVGDEEADSSDVELDAGESETVELEWQTTTDDVGDHELVIVAGGDEVSATATVEDAPASFDVEITRTPEHVTSGVAVDVVVTVENTGTLEGTQDIDISVGDEVVHTVSNLTLAGTETETIEYTYETADEDAPDITVEVASEDDEDSATVPVVTESVTPLREYPSKGGMGVIGWIIFLGMVIVLIPLLPFLALIKLIDILRGSDRPVR